MSSKHKFWLYTIIAILWFSSCTTLGVVGKLHPQPGPFSQECNNK